MKAEGCSTPVEEDVEVEAGGATPAVETFRVKPLDCTGVEDADTVVVLAAEVELGGMLIFIFRASSSGLDAAGAELTLTLGSRLMTGVFESVEEAVGRGEARRLLRVVMLLEEAGWREVETAGATDFSGSGAGVSRTFWILLSAAFFSSSRSFTVMV